MTPAISGIRLLCVWYSIVYSWYVLKYPLGKSQDRIWQMIPFCQQLVFILYFPYYVSRWKHILQLHEPRIFYPSGLWPGIVGNAHVSAHFRLSLGASVISPYIRPEELYVKTTIIYQLKRLCVPDCAYTENMSINSIHISLYATSLTQNISYQIL